MGKDPAFLFYSKDFLSGIQDLTMEERGQYITLLCLQHQKGRLTKKAIDIICHGNATADVMAKFRQDDGGLFFNPRLEEETIKRQKHCEKQSERAKDGWNKRKNDAAAYTTAYAVAMPLVNANVNAIVNEDVNTKKNIAEREMVFSSDVFSFKNSYSEEMLNNFFDYWAETDALKKKMKFEQQKTWDLTLRLKRWSKNNFKQNGKLTQFDTARPGSILSAI